MDLLERYMSKDDSVSIAVFIMMLDQKDQDVVIELIDSRFYVSSKQ